MRARRRKALIAFKLAAFAILMPATAGLSAQTTLGWPSNSGQNPAAAPAQSAPSALDNYLQQQAYPQPATVAPLPFAVDSRELVDLRDFVDVGVGLDGLGFLRSPHQPMLPGPRLRAQHALARARPGQTPTTRGSVGASGIAGGAGGGAGASWRCGTPCASRCSRSMRLSSSAAASAASERLSTRCEGTWFENL